ncbi:hypothetical protein OEZ49_11340 [Ruegeria sp. WL0004]|uniref:Uncharacterized protein n=1 Tax=Ruegeria marisflavi TaxID=2984152 RepID=A0ABT2WSY0_9RHOB|nr:hypothetical protein [Ruegeria sp. WL0004]MCU9838362.1 hypothetical protein [Ruegeria sp. WL0004]
MGPFWRGGLAALPLATPEMGRGEQMFNPIQATDLARIIMARLTKGPDPGAHEIGRPERVTQGRLLKAIRRWLELRPVPVLPIPRFQARGISRVGDALRFEPISTTALD